MGSRLRLDRRDVRLAPGASAKVGLAVRVPRGTAAGDHYGGVVAADRGELRRAAQRPAEGSKGVVLRRVDRMALPVRVTLPGAATRRLALGGISFAADASGSSLGVRLRSTGQRLVRSTAVDLRVAKAGKPVFRHRVALAEIVPGTGFSYPVPWRGAAPTRGTYHVTGTIAPAGGPRLRIDERIRFGVAQAKVVGGRTGRSVAPEPEGDAGAWVLRAAFGGLGLLALTASIGYLRLRRRVAAGSGLGGTPAT